MSGGMPELGSKISLISKADIRYEGRLFTVDPQECTIALANGEFQVVPLVKSSFVCEISIFPDGSLALLFSKGFTISFCSIRAQMARR